MAGLETIGAFLLGGGATAGTATGASAGLGSTLSTIGTVASAGGTVLSGVAAKRDADFVAAQEQQQAAEERAAASREAQQKRREGALVQSRQQALAAASGAGAGTDAPTIVKLMTDTAGQADYNARTVLYGGEQRARGLEASARARRRSGTASLLGSIGGGFGQAVKGFK
ncbi:hypothetical protein [Brucella sp. IR073]|uniref:hypothetical protein n=1 Tax=unclassified Brucella TaxID=2632610 RepID=UPI003B9810F3